MARRPKVLARSTVVAALIGSATVGLGMPAAWAAAPTITSFDPTSGPIGTTVEITGTGFQDASVATGVTFNGTAATFTVDSNVQITATVPAGATDGPIAVTDSEGTATSAASFDVTPSPVPTITSFTPTSGDVGSSVVITGTGFTGASAVTFGGTAATDLTVDSDTQITVTVPPGAVTGPIVVTTPGGTATSATDFTVTGGTPTTHDRSVTLNLRRHLIARGRVFSDFDGCRSNVTVMIQRLRPAGWRTVETDTTTADGRYRERIADRVGRYRALVPRFEPDPDDVCVRDVSPRRRHRH
jgi:IPT/TIG domain